MERIFVQFTDETQTSVMAVLGCPQDPEAWPNQGVLEETDERYLSFLVPPEVPAPIVDPLEKLKVFLKDNPDVAAILQ